MQFLFINFHRNLENMAGSYLIRCFSESHMVVICDTWSFIYSELREWQLNFYVLNYVLKVVFMVILTQLQWSAILCSDRAPLQLV